MRFFNHSSQPNIVLGTNGILPGISQVRMRESDLARHLHIVGEPGMGKSKLLESMIVQLIMAGRGLGVLDPHSVLIDDIFRNLISRKMELEFWFYHKIIYVDPAREDYAIPFNALKGGGTVYDRATAVLEAFRRTWSHSLKEAPQFTNIALAALITLIENDLTLVDMTRLLVDRDFREDCLNQVTYPAVIEFFHDRYDRCGREAPLMRESTLNKVGALAINDRLRRMLGQSTNKLDFRKIMDEGHVLLVDLGRCDRETAKLLGNLIVTGIELAMRRRQTREPWHLFIDEFAGYVANEGSVTSFGNVLGEARKYGLSLIVSHQNALAQLPPSILGSLRTTQKILFGINRMDAEYFARLIGHFDPRQTKTVTTEIESREHFIPRGEQMETWIDRLRFQPDRYALYAKTNGEIQSFRTASVPQSESKPSRLDDVKQICAIRHGVNLEDVETQSVEHTGLSVPASEPV